MSKTESRLSSDARPMKRRRFLGIAVIAGAATFAARAILRTAKRSDAEQLLRHGDRRVWKLA